MTDTISALYMIEVPLDPMVCLLGAVDREIFTPPTNIAIIRLLYIARKQIAGYLLIPLLRNFG